MRKRGVYIFVLVLCIMLAIAVAGLVVHEYTTLGKISGATWFRAALVILSCLSAVVKLTAGKKARKTSHRTIESAFKDIVEFAFTYPEQKKDRQILFTGIDLFNRDKYDAAIRTLSALKPRCQRAQDYYAVLLFIALSYKNLGNLELARDTYLEITRRDPSKSRAWSNLGLICAEMGNFTSAGDCYEKAISAEPNNAFPYVNLANLYIQQGEFEKSIPYAEKSLSLKGDMYQASNALAIAYAVLGNREMSERYIKISVANGVRGQELRQAIRAYLE